RSSNRGSSFSMPTMLISTGGSVVHMRPLPSDSRITSVPVSAIAKLAPLMPTRARRNRSRRWRRAASASSAGSSPSAAGPIVRRAGIAGPVHDGAGGRRCRLELEQVAVEVREHVALDRLPCRPQLLPVGHLGDGGGALLADGRGGMAEVAPQLGVSQLDASRLGEAGGAAFRAAHDAARISARWMVRTA